jgi:hypothetical protein
MSEISLSSLDYNSGFSNVHISGEINATVPLVQIDIGSFQKSVRIGGLFPLDLLVSVPISGSMSERNRTILKVNCSVPIRHIVPMESPGMETFIDLTARDVNKCQWFTNSNPFYGNSMNRFGSFRFAKVFPLYRL